MRLFELQTKSAIAQVAELYLKHCSTWSDIENPLWRRNESIVPASVRSTRERSKQDGSLEVQNWMFSQPEWQGYPRRTHSVFCGTTLDIAVGDDDTPVYAIYPFDNTKIAVVGDHDFQLVQLSPESKYANLRYIAWAVKDLKRSLGLSSVDELVKGNFEKAKSDLDPTLVNLTLHHLPELLLPSNFGMQTAVPSSLKAGEPAREVWFEGNYVCVPVHELRAFIAAVKQLQK